jgi:hypothetical protein
MTRRSTIGVSPRGFISGWPLPNFFRLQGMRVAWQHSALKHEMKSLPYRAASGSCYLQHPLQPGTGLVPPPVVGSTSGYRPTDRQISHACWLEPRTSSASSHLNILHADPTTLRWVKVE